MMIFYVFLLGSIYLLLKEVKSPTKRKKIVFLYASIFAVALIYNFGEFVGKQMYLLGV